jgi:transcriptional regulator with XRE-family HTH domain
MVTNKDIGKRIKEIRIEYGLSQHNFGERLSVSQDTVSLWEKGKSIPTAEFLIAIATQFEVSVDYILCLKDY